MKPIEMVRATRTNGHRYYATDEDGRIFSFPDNAKPFLAIIDWDCRSAEYKEIGRREFCENWKNTLIDVTKILVN